MTSRSDDWEARYAAVKRLADRDDAEVVPELLSHAGDLHHSVRCAVAQALGRRPGDERALEALVSFMADPEPWVRIRAVQSLAAFRGTAAPDFLAQHLASEEDEKVRATLVKVLGGFGDERFIATLLPYLQDDDARVRANTVEGLGAIPSRQVQKLLLPCLRDPNSRIRANTARVMHRFADAVADSQATLSSMLASADQYERAAAAYAVGELRDDQYLDPLLHLIADSSFVVRRNAVDALVKYGPPIEERLAKRLDDRDPVVRLGLCLVLGRVGGAACRRHLIPHLDDPDGEVRSRAEEALDAIGRRATAGGAH